MYRLKMILLSILLMTLMISAKVYAAPGDVKKALEANGIKKIAIIPPVEPQNYIIAYLKKEGLDSMVKVLTSQEYVNPDVFNSKNFQLAIYAGYEKYIQSLKEPSDGDKAILDYVGGGGTFLLLGNGPTPVYLNEKNKPANSSALFGINIVFGKDDKFSTAMGFEKPADGAKLSYSVKKELKAIDATLPDKFPFPVQGDLRWRPCVNKNSSKAYIPLISMTDSAGTWLGDAIAYNSGVIYAYFRTTQPDEPNRDKIIGGLLIFASKPGLPRTVNKAAAGLEKLKALAAKFKNTRIAYLPCPEQTAIEAWLSKSGIQYDKLSWEEVVDTKKFNVMNYPIAVYAGQEKYKQTVKVYADVDEMLVKYMEDGGFMVFNSNYPWPMYMNEDNEATFVTGKMGFPICGIDDAGTPNPDPKLIGFEKPKPELTFNYLVNKKYLPNLVAKLPFPASGDQRWRPIVGTALPKSDTYISLVELYDDDNNYYGDGIAYVYHKTSQPVGGKALYVWYRAADLLGAEELYGDLFAFIAEMKK